MNDIVDTTWDQIADVLKARVGQLDQPLRARHVKLMIVRLLEHDLAVVTEEAANSQVRSVQTEQWIKRLRTYAENHAPLPHEVDDSRESIYAEAVRDIG